MVERPLLQQLAVMGWEYLQGDMDYPQKTFRENFRDVLLREPLRKAILKINSAENLDHITIDRAIRELERSDKSGGLDRNRELTEKLIKGVSVPWATGGDSPHSRNVTVRFIDFDLASQSSDSFLAINQFRIDYIGRVGFVIPDVILFVNGIPLVIIECKSPSLAGFWESIPARNKLKADIQATLLQPAYTKPPGLIKKRAQIISRVMAIADKNNDVILYAE